MTHQPDIHEYHTQTFTYMYMDAYTQYCTCQRSLTRHELVYIRLHRHSHGLMPSSFPSVCECVCVCIARTCVDISYPPLSHAILPYPAFASLSHAARLLSPFWHATMTPLLSGGSDVDTSFRNYTHAKRKTHAHTHVQREIHRTARCPPSCHVSTREMRSRALPSTKRNQ